MILNPYFLKMLTYLQNLPDQAITPSAGKHKATPDVNHWPNDGIFLGHLTYRLISLFQGKGPYLIRPLRGWLVGKASALVEPGRPIPLCSRPLSSDHR
jgi:hypothetical protein